MAMTGWSQTRWFEYHGKRLRSEDVSGFLNHARRMEHTCEQCKTTIKIGEPYFVPNEYPDNTFLYPDALRYYCMKCWATTKHLNWRKELATFIAIKLTKESKHMKTTKPKSYAVYDCESDKAVFRKDSKYLEIKTWGKPKYDRSNGQLVRNQETSTATLI